MAPSNQILAYMDDVLILSPDQASHSAALYVALSFFQKHGWQLNFQKCKWAPSEVDFLGGSLSPKGWQPTHDVLEKLTTLPQPITRGEWRAVKGWLHDIYGVGERLWINQQLLKELNMPKIGTVLSII